jgi:hypothetical protein
MHVFPVFAGQHVKHYRRRHDADGVAVASHDGEHAHTCCARALGRMFLVGFGCHSRPIPTNQGGERLAAVGSEQAAELYDSVIALCVVGDDDKIGIFVCGRLEPLLHCAHGRPAREDGNACDHKALGGLCPMRVACFSRTSVIFRHLPPFPSALVE